MGYLVTETRADGTLIRDYIWQEGRQPLAQIDNRAGVESIIYLYADQLMTNRLATDATRAVVWRWEGEAFGNTPAQELAGIRVNLRFPGQYFDADSGLYYNHFRYYDPNIGRYITVDPIGLGGGLNTYGYASQNPLMYIDPYGLSNWPLLPQGIVDATSGFGDALSFGVTDWVRDQIGTNYVVDVCSPFYKGGKYAGYGWGLGLGGSGLYRGFRAGREFSLGKNFRIAPFGNRTGHPTGRLPLYHRRNIDPATGQTRPGQGIGTHRPWDKKSTDKSVRDRF